MREQVAGRRIIDGYPVQSGLSLKPRANHDDKPVNKTSN